MKQKTSKKAGFEEFIKEISSGEISPLYIFKGDQIYLIDQALQELKNRVLGEADDTNYIIFHGDSASAEEILESASTIPMFSNRKLVVVKNAEKLNTKELAFLEPYF